MMRICQWTVDERYDVRGSDLASLVMMCLTNNGIVSKNRRKQYQYPYHWKYSTLSSRPSSAGLRRNRQTTNRSEPGSLLAQRAA